MSNYQGNSCNEGKENTRSERLIEKTVGQGKFLIIVMLVVRKHQLCDGMGEIFLELRMQPKQKPNNETDSGISEGWKADVLAGAMLSEEDPGR